MVVVVPGVGAVDLQVARIGVAVLLQCVGFVVAVLLQLVGLGWAVLLKLLRVLPVVGMGLLELARVMLIFGVLCRNASAWSEKLLALWTLPKPPRPKPASVLWSANPPSPKREPPPAKPRSGTHHRHGIPQSHRRWNPPKPPPWNPPNPPRNATASSAPITRHAANAALANSPVPV